MFYDFINVEIESITGVNNPLYIIGGIVTKKNYHFEIFADGESVAFESKKGDDSKSFLIEALLPKQAKKIEVYLVFDNKKFIIRKFKNNKVNRIKRKLMSFTLIRKISRIFFYLERGFYNVYKGLKILWKEHHFVVPFSEWRRYYSRFLDKIHAFRNRGKGYNDPNIQEEYNNWIDDFERVDKTIEVFSYNPLISIVIPVYNISRKYLSECLDSILCQTYQNFEICLADDCSTNPETLETLKEYTEKDSRVKVVYRKENGHISKATNFALEIASGEFIALCDNDDFLTPNALYENVKVLNEDPTLDLIYSDEDKVDLKGIRRDPNFKPDFSPELFYSSNYFCHFTVIRKSIVDEIGRYRVGYEGAQDYDLFLRVCEKTNRIYHLPKILYHWRMIPGSTAATIDSKGYAVERGRLALQDSLDRRGIKGNVKVHPSIPYYLIDYTYDVEPSVSIIIPTKDHAETLNTCLKSIYKKTTYKNYEIIVVDNNSSEKETFDLLDKYKSKYKNFRVVEAKMGFNYSRINNIAIQQSTADFVCLLNNDTEVITPHWLSTMVGYAMQKHVGAVGAKLLYPDSTVQHAGVIMGFGGIANHVGVGARRTEIGPYGRLAIPHNYCAVTAACLVVERKKYDEVNGLEEQLEVSYNDVDFNLKLLEKGYYNVCLPQVELYHYESKSRGLPTQGAKLEQFNREQEFMRQKWSKYIDNDPFYNLNLSRVGLFMIPKKSK